MADREELRERSRQMKEEARQRREHQEETPDTDARDQSGSRRRQLRQKAARAGKAVAGTLSRGAKSVAGTLRQGASDLTSDAASAASSAASTAASAAREAAPSADGRTLRVRYSDETEEWHVAGPTAGFGTYATKAEAKKRAREIYNNQSDYVEEGAYTRLAIHGKSGGVNPRESRGFDEPEAQQRSPGSSQRAEQRQQTVNRGISLLGSRMDSGGGQFAAEASQWDASQPEQPGTDEGENHQAAAAFLAGGGFMGPGDPPALVAVDEDRDGEFEPDETAVVRPPGMAAPEQSGGAGGDERRPRSPPRFGLGPSPDPAAFPGFGAPRAEGGDEQERDDGGSFGLDALMGGSGPRF